MSPATDPKPAYDFYQKLFMIMKQGFVLYETVLDKTGAPADYRFLEINPAFELITGLKTEYIIGKAVLEVFTKSGPFWVEQFKRATRTGKPLTIEHYVREFDKYLKVDVYCPAAERLACVIVDITEREVSAKALNESEEKYRSLYNRTPVMLHSIDVNGLLISVSDYWLETMGYTREEVLGRKSSDFLTEASRRYAIETVLPEFNKNGYCYNIEYQFVKKNGEIIDTLLSAISENDENDTYTRSLAVIINITKRKKTEEALQEKEREYRELVESANTVILRWKPDGVITYMNKFGEELFGFIRYDLIGKNVIGTIVEATESGGRDLELMIRGIASEPDRFKNNENENMTRDGRKLWIQWDNSFLMDSAGRVAEVISHGRDMTERKRAEEALKGSEEKFRTLVESSFDVIFVLDAQGNFVFVSPAWEKHFGYPVSEILGQSFAPFVHPDDPPLLIEYLLKVMSSGQSATSPPYRVRCADGSWRLFIANGTTYFDEHGNYLYIGVGRDISQQKQAEEERLNLERQLLHSQKLESLGVLAGGIAHDFNNLLQAILGNLELASMKLSPHSAPLRYIEHSKHAAKHAAELTSRMLAYSGKGHFFISRLDLNQLVNENAAMLRTAVSRSISMNLHTEALLPPIMADVAQIQQVVMNLITNASEAISEQPGSITLTTGVQNFDRERLADSRLPEKPEPGRFVFLEVTDNGIGMDAETQARIFDPFFSTKFVGRGLGMSSVLGIAKGHGGAIFVKSTPGNGTTMMVAFPAIDSASAGIFQNYDADTSEMSPSAITPLSGVALVVDDDKSVLKIAVTMVKLCGLRVIMAGNGVEAVRKFREHTEEINVVLMDLTMPQMDGIAAMHELRLIKPDLKIILSSGFNEHELDERVNREAPTGFVRKPYSMKNLETELRRVISLPQTHWPSESA